ncbi:hypothetical protein ELK61_28240, partial [Klebsiella pneumoniae]|nr:hypothetical protein [Klebsiella pneumoniae]
PPPPLFFFFIHKTSYELQRSLVGSEMCIRDRVKSVLQASPLMRTVNTYWGSRVPVMHFSLNPVSYTHL